MGIRAGLRPPRIPLLYLVHLSTATTQKRSAPPWVIFRSARWVSIGSAPTVSQAKDESKRDFSRVYKGVSNSLNVNENFGDHAQADGLVYNEVSSRGLRWLRKQSLCSHLSPCRVLLQPLSQCQKTCRRLSKTPICATTWQANGITNYRKPRGRISKNP